MSILLFGTAFLMSADVAASTLDSKMAEPVRDSQQSADVPQSVDTASLNATASPAERNDFVIPLLTTTPTPINIGNFVWDDLNKNGRQDAGEPGFPGVTVQLWNASKTNLLDNTVTDAFGSYVLSAPNPGSYRVRALLPNPANDQFSPKNKSDGNDNKDSDVNPSGTHFGFTAVIDIGSNVANINNIDIGIIKFIPPTPTATPEPINIGNFVWNDLDRDGRQDAGEPGIPGVSVQLWNTEKTNLFDIATTNDSGKYKLTAPQAGSYRVRVVPASGTVFTAKNQGSDAQDSDINPGGPHTGFTVAFDIAANTSSVMNIDAGLKNAD